MKVRRGKNLGKDGGKKGEGWGIGADLTVIKSLSRLDLTVLSIFQKAVTLNHNLTH